MYVKHLQRRELTFWMPSLGDGLSQAYVIRDILEIHSLRNQVDTTGYLVDAYTIVQRMWRPSHAWRVLLPSLALRPLQISASVSIRNPLAVSFKSVSPSLSLTSSPPSASPSTFSRFHCFHHRRSHSFGRRLRLGFLQYRLHFFPLSLTSHFQANILRLTTILLPWHSSSETFTPSLRFKSTKAGTGACPEHIASTSLTDKAYPPSLPSPPSPIAHDHPHQVACHRCHSHLHCDRNFRPLLLPPLLRLLRIPSPWRSPSSQHRATLRLQSSGLPRLRSCRRPGPRLWPRATQIRAIRQLAQGGRRLVTRHANLEPGPR